MSQDIDYQPDVLKFKHVWDDKKKLSKTGLKDGDKTGVDAVNFQTIESTNNNNAKRKHSNQVHKQPQVKGKRQSVKKEGHAKKEINFSIQGSKGVLRNPRAEGQVIQVQTKPSKFYHSGFVNQKNNIAQSHLYFDTMGQNKGENGLGSVSMYGMKKALEQKDYELSLLRVSNSRTEDRVRYLERELQKKDQIIDQMRQRERKALQSHSTLQSKQFNFDYGKAEYHNFKSDSRRLLRMLQATNQYNHFATFALDDDGVRFLNEANKSNKSKLDNPNKNSKTIHYCSCNKQFIPQTAFWVPQNVYSFGKQFVKQRNGQMTQPELQLLLYELNRIWREREKRIINTQAAMKAHEVGKYKRQVKNLQLKTNNRTKSVNQFEKDRDQNNEE